MFIHSQQAHHAYRYPTIHAIQKHRQKRRTSVLRTGYLYCSVALAAVILALPLASHAQTKQDPSADAAPGATTTQTESSTAQKKLDENLQQLNARQEELKELDDRINELSSQHTTASSQAELAADQLARISKKLLTAELELDQTILSITITQQDMEIVEEQLAGIAEELAAKKDLIRENLRLIYQHEQASLIDVLLGSQSLSELLADRRAYRELQERALVLVDELREAQQEQQARQEELIQQEASLQQLKEVQAYQQADLAEQRSVKDNFLRLKQTEQAGYEQKIAEARQARADIEQQIFTLQGIGVELALNDAFSAARFASSVTGVRPALLLAMAKVETNVGENIGSGVFPDDMHPASRDAFLRLMPKLGRDPYNTPISRRPTSYQGWGGAIGPGQFMPDTWERLEQRVADLMKKPAPDPFALPDSLVGIGIMLADRGAADPANEIEATARYLAGPNWQYHLWYSARVQAVAAEYVQEGLE